MRINNLNFFLNSAIILSKKILGNYICVKTDDGNVIKLKIKEAECYMDEKDSASHAAHGKTNRSKIMWEEGGICYVYLNYGLHYMLNVVCGKKGFPQAVLIRAAGEFNGPGKLTRALGVDKSFNGENFLTSERIWIEKGKMPKKIVSLKRVGIDSAKEKDRNKKWRRLIIEE